MIDKSIVRGKIGEKGRFAAFQIHVEGNKLFYDYGLEYIRESVRLLLCEAFSKDETTPEQLDNRIIEVVGCTVAKASRGIAIMELKKILSGGPDEVRKLVREVMEGSDEE